MSFLITIMLHILLLGLLTFNTSTQSIILGACKDNEFKCDDGVCIPKAWQCDYEIDCANREDERFDIDGNECVPCEERGYFCHDSTAKCIPPQWKCDGWSDCQSGDDETYCTSCTDQQFQCNDGKCIDVSLLCDLHNDCYDAEDEIHDINGDDCSACPFTCDTDTCLTADKLCDGHFDCSDKTDECNTNICPNNQPIECNQSQTHSTVSPIATVSPSPSTSHASRPIKTPYDDTPNWKYCPSDIVWLGFVNSQHNEHNINMTAAVYWIEPKVREEGKYYTKYSTSYNSGDRFAAGFYTIEYIAKKMMANGTSSNSTDDPIFCYLRILVLDGMRDYLIAECEAQSQNDYLEWELVVDDRSYSIAYFDIGQYTANIERARFVPQNDKFHTDCYARIAFETGLIQNDEEIVIQQTVNWMVSHLYALIGLIVGVVLLFVILLIIIIILWRKQVEMKEFILADTYDKDEIPSSEDDDDESVDILQTLQQQRPSAIDLDITTPGGVGYLSGNNSINTHNHSHGQMPYITSITSSHSYSGRSNGNNNASRTQFEYSLGHLNNNINVMKENDHELSTNIDDISDTDSSDSEDDNDNLLRLKTKNSKNRRPSILGVNYEQLKLLQDKDNKKRMDRDADKLLEAEWDRESQTSQGF